MALIPSDFTGHKADGDPDDEREHFYQCKKCGQEVDKRDLGQVMYHEMPIHDRLQEQ